MRKPKYSYEMMQDAVAACTSVRGLILYFGLKETGGNYTHMSLRVKRFGINIDHFTGQAWAKGHTVDTHPAIKNVTKKISVPEDIHLSANSPHSISKHRLRKLVFKHKEYICVECGTTPEWRGKPLTLHLDHINGNNHDNRLENLQFLCPNCHQQTPTWGAGNRGNGWCA